MIEQSEASGFVHRFLKGNEHTLLLLHGTGGDETDMIPIGRTLAPLASILTLRGPVLEGGAARFFRPMTPSGFDIQDILARTRQLGDFLKLAAGAYGFDTRKVIPVGYSNGANIAASMLLTGAAHVPAAVLFRPMVICEPEQLPDLSATFIYISAGNLDPLVSEENSTELAALFKTAGARVTLTVENAGHGLTSHGIDAARDWLRAKGVV